MSTAEQVPGELSNEGYRFINGTPVPMPDINSIHAIEARRVEANTGGSYLEYIATRLAMAQTVEDGGILVTDSLHPSQVVGFYREYLHTVLHDDPRIDDLTPVEVERWFMDYNARDLGQ